MIAQWTAVDNYISEKLVAEDPILEQVLRNNAAAGLPEYDVSANQGKFLQLIAMISGAKSILEIGTLGGYSTIWLARGLGEGGNIVTLEANEKHVAVAKSNIKFAGFSDKVEVRAGTALDSLAQLVAENHPPFDLVFIDADKPNNPRYLEWVLKLSRKGSVIISDNLVRNGEVIEEGSEDPSVQGVRRYYECLSEQPNLESIAVQTVGIKGYDGFAISVVV